MSAQISKAPKAIYKSCPFCGAMDEQLKLLELEDSGGHSVVCDCCGAIGPTDTRKEKAEALWNGAALVALRLPAERAV